MTDVTFMIIIAVVTELNFCFEIETKSFICINLQQQLGTDREMAAI